MFWYMITNQSNCVWVEECEMASMKGYLVQYVPSGNLIWCEKSCFERYYRPMF